MRAVCTCVHGCVYARVRLPACLLQGQERPLGEEVQSVTNQVIFITAVRLGEEGGEGAEEQPQQLTLQTRSCSARGRQPGAGARPWGSPAHRDPSPHPLTHLLPAILPSRSGQRGLPHPSLPSVSSLLYLSGWVWGGVDGEGPGTTIPRRGS